MNLFLFSFAALFSVINPLGTLPVFVGLTKNKSRKEINRIAVWTAVDTFVILLISFFLGKFLLLFFGISLNSLKIAGGMIIASSGFAMLTGSFNKHKGMKKRVKDDAQMRSDISLTPLAIPMLAGPGTISLLITYEQQYSRWLDKLIISLDVVAVSVVIFLFLRSSQYIVKALGASGINALSRIIGFVIIAMGVEYILSTLVLLF